jgi:hypothetical protein
VVVTYKLFRDPPNPIHRHKQVKFTHFLCLELCPSNLYNFRRVLKLLTKFFDFLDVDPKTGL